MNYRYYYFYTIKFLPVLLVILNFEELISKTVSNPQESYIRIALLVFLAILQLFSLKLEYVSIYEDKFEILGWNKFDIKNWKEVSSLKVQKFNNPNFGVIILKNNKKIYFISFNGNFTNWIYSNQKGLNSNLDLIDKIKFIYSI